MKAEFHIISVFDKPQLGFRGNPSAVVFLPQALDTRKLQAIASDFNQPATTFLWQEQGKWQVRWFAPDAEIGLCGHGTLAAFAALSNSEASTVTLHFGSSKATGGMLSNGDCYLELEPIGIGASIPVPTAIQEGLGVDILEMYETENKHLIVVKDAATVKSIKPNFSRLRDSEIFGYAVTAAGDDVDFVSRTLVPHVQQLEDHATGSSHVVLTGFWSQKLKKNKLTAHQWSKRGGAFLCEQLENQVRLSGSHTAWAKGELSI